MKANKSISLSLAMLWVFSSCGSGGGGGGGSSDFSKLSYSEAVALNTQKGLDSTAAAASIATTYSALLQTDVNGTDPAVLQSALDGYANALSAYNTLINDIVTLNNITFPEDKTALTLDGTKAQYTDPSGVDTLNSATDAILAKKKECDALFAKVPRLPSSPSDFDKLLAAQKCMREFEAVAAEQAVDAAVSNAAGFTGGAAAGAAVVYFVGGNILSGGGLLVVTAAGFIGSRVVGAIWNACKPASGTKLSLKDATGGDVCSFSHARGETGGNLLLQAVGTGTLQIFIDGCAPISFKNITIENGQSLAVAAKCEPLDDAIDPNDVANASINATSDLTTPDPTTCAGITALTTVSTDPAPGESANVTLSTLPVAPGCTVSYTLSGTDGYHQADTLTTDGFGEASFTVPGAVANTVDTVTTTEAETGISRTITYTF